MAVLSYYMDLIEYVSTYYINKIIATYIHWISSKGTIIL